MKKNKTFSEITVTRRNSDDPDYQVTDNETGEEVVAIITADEVVTLDGYQVRMTEIIQEDPGHVMVTDEDSGEEVAYAVIDVDDDEGFDFIEEGLAELGVPIDKEIIKLVVDSWHDYLEELGIAQREKDQDN